MNETTAERKAVTASTFGIAIAVAPGAVAVLVGWPWFAAAPIVFGCAFAWVNGIRARRRHRSPVTGRYTGFAAGVWVGLVALVLGTAGVFGWFFVA